MRVDPGPRGAILEGASRPGFFHGVLTVVMKLCQLTRPDFAFFGEKDYQQLALITQMVADLDVPVTIVGVPTVREPDGLARSSRNRYLSPAGRVAALALSAALRAGARRRRARARRRRCAPPQPQIRLRVRRRRRERNAGTRLRRADRADLGPAPLAVRPDC